MFENLVHCANSGRSTGNFDHLWFLFFIAMELLLETYCKKQVGTF